MKPGRTVLAQILDYLWVVIANDDAHTAFHHAPGDRLLLQLGMWLKRPLSVRCQAVHRGCFERSPLEVGGDHRIRNPRLSSRPVRSGDAKKLRIAGQNLRLARRTSCPARSDPGGFSTIQRARRDGGAAGGGVAAGSRQVAFGVTDGRTPGFHRDWWSP